MNLSCLTDYPPIPSIPKTANDSNPFDHPPYNPSSGGLTQLISVALARSTLSTDEIHKLFYDSWLENDAGLSVSEITKIKPILSTIIYVSVALALFLIFFIVFCVVSCGCCKKDQERGNGRSKTTKICVCLLIFVYLLGIGDMIYVAYRINKWATSMDDTIKGVNEEIFPKEIAEHVQYFGKQLNILDEYCVQPDSLLINASKSMVTKAFGSIATEKYFIQNISQSINSTDDNMRELRDAVNKSSTLPDLARDLFHEIDEQYKLMLVNVQMPIEGVCDYTDGTDTDIDKKLLEALDVVHVQVKQLTDTITQNILEKITPWEENKILDTDTEEQVRKYVRLTGTIFLVVVIVLGLIPLLFFLVILISRLCCSGSRQSTNEEIPLTTMGTNTNLESNLISTNRPKYRRKNTVVPENYRRQKNSSCLVPCLMRCAFSIIMIFMILMLFLTTIYYVLDLAMQGTCRTAHDDQPFAIDLLTKELIKKNVIFGNSSQMNVTLMNVIHDCGNQTHFSRKLSEGYWSTLDDDVMEMMNTLSKKFYDQFNQSIGNIDIAKNKDLLTNFTTIVQVTEMTALAEAIKADLTIIDGYFAQIKASDSTLPRSLVQNTIDEFKTYMRTVLESTVDPCPLPLSTILKTDILVCHSLGGAFSGLWLSVFIFMVWIILGFCIFGICVYKRLNTSSGSESSSMTF